MANSVDPVQTAPIGAVCSVSTLFAFILNSSEILGKVLQQTTSADDIFRCTFFLVALRVKCASFIMFSLFTPYFDIASIGVQKCDRLVSFHFKC